MKVSILISLAFSISVLAGCAGSGKTILEERAGYEESVPGVGIGKSGDVRYVPTRIPERVIVAWLFAHELPSKDYFWGSWLSIVVSPESWEMVKTDVPKKMGGKPKTQPKPRTAPPQKLPEKSAP